MPIQQIFVCSFVVLPSYNVEMWHFVRIRLQHVRLAGSVAVIPCIYWC